MWRCLLLILLLPACAPRPLTGAERAFAATIHGPDLDVTRVRIHGRNPLYALEMTRDPRPPLTCRERIRPPETAPVPTRIAATVLYERAFFARPFYLDDFLTDYPDRLDLAAAMLFAHEMTHVWQWQNADRTGYSPFRAAQEHQPGVDPYLFDLDPDMPFHAYDYEQQAGLVEEFVCCRALALRATRTQTLFDLLKPAFPTLARRSAVPFGNISLPYKSIDTRGICSS